MKKVICLFLFTFAFIKLVEAQNLRNTEWSTYWEAPINDSIHISFGADTMFVTNPEGTALITSLYSEDGDTLTLQDLSGPYSCLSDQIGMYQFEIIDGQKLSFTSINDDCIGRQIIITSTTITLRGLTSLRNIGTIKMEMYPNPATEHLVIEAIGHHNIRVFTQNGKVIYNSSFKDRLDLNLMGFQKGLYVVNIDNVSKKLLID